MGLILSIPAIVWLIGSAIFFVFGEFLSKNFTLATSFSYVIIFAVIAVVLLSMIQIILLGILKK